MFHCKNGYYGHSGGGRGGTPRTTLVHHMVQWYPYKLRGCSSSRVRTAFRAESEIFTFGMLHALETDVVWYSKTSITAVCRSVHCVQQKKCKGEAVLIMFSENEMKLIVLSNPSTIRAVL